MQIVLLMNQSIVFIFKNAIIFQKPLFIIYFFVCKSTGIACLIVGGILMFTTPTSTKDVEASPLIPVFTGVMYLANWGFVLRLYMEMKDGKGRYDTISLLWKVPNDNEIIFSLYKREDLSI